MDVDRTEGTRRPLTMEDVARAAGVSRALVSLVLRGQPGASDATRRRVVAVARHLGYQPNAAASRLAAGSSHTVGVMFTLRNSFHTDIVEGIYPRAEAAGYDVILSGTGPSRCEPEAVATLVASRCAGAVLLGPVMDSAHLIELSRSLPLVVIGEQPTPLVCDCIFTDDNQGVCLALDFLYELGHRDIAYVSGGPGFSMRSRVAAYSAWMEGHGLGGMARIVHGADTEPGGMAAGEALLGTRHLPTAVLAANDRCALGLLAVLRLSGVSVPGEMSVMGYDDIELSRYGGIPLSTVRQDSQGLAGEALAALLDRIGDAAMPARAVRLEASLRVRSTTAPPAVRTL